MKVSGCDRIRCLKNKILTVCAQVRMSRCALERSRQIQKRNCDKISQYIEIRSVCVCGKRIEDDSKLWPSFIRIKSNSCGDGGGDDQIHV